MKVFAVLEGEYEPSLEYIFADKKTAFKYTVKRRNEDFLEWRDYILRNGEKDIECNYYNHREPTFFYIREMEVQ